MRRMNPNQAARTHRVLIYNLEEPGYKCRISREAFHFTVPLGTFLGSQNLELMAY